MLSMAILGLLLEQPLHGYEIRIRLHKLLGINGLISFGSLYPILSTLHRQGYVSVEIITPEISPNTKPKLSERKKRKVYTITEEGRQAFQEKLTLSIAKNATDDRAFVAHLAFIEHAKDKDSEILISHRERALRDRLDLIPTTNNLILKRWHELEANYIQDQINFIDSLKEKEK